MNKIREISAVVMLLFAIVISFLAMFMPPPGVIDPSVLWIVAQALLFAASVLGLDAFTMRLIDGKSRDTPSEWASFRQSNY